jgi:hypothetical protein
MSFAKRFNEVSCDIVHVSNLEVNRPYPIERADRVTTRFGQTVLLDIRDTAEDRLYKLFLPHRYSSVFTDDDMLTINDGLVLWNIISKGRNPDTNAYQLSVEEGSLLGVDHAV